MSTTVFQQLLAKGL